MPHIFLPTMITLCNFACGVLAILAVFGERIGLGFVLISLGIVFDLFDGWTARKLNAVSEFGKELDSLSDIVTFGVAPAVLEYYFVLYELGQVGVIIALLYCICSVLRLARFNATQSELPTFIGLPVPLAAIGLMICTWLMSPGFLAIGTCILAYLMVSNIKIPHFKKMKDDEEEYYGAH